MDHEGRLPLHWATDNDAPDCVVLLLDDVPGQTADATDAAGMTPLMWAAFHNKVWGVGERDRETERETHTHTERE